MLVTAGLALATVELTERRGLVPVDLPFQPNPANRATYDRPFPEFTHGYKAQPKMFSRLNR